ncbi:hypothetical protein GCM10027067_39960 [Pseudactinotalea suaedae]
MDRAESNRVRHTRRVETRQLRADEADLAVALWTRCGLVRPWNEPRGDVARALDGDASTILKSEAKRS